MTIHRFFSSPDRRGVTGDALVALALGVALLAAGWLDVRAYRSGQGKFRPAFALMSASAGGRRLGWEEFFQEASTVVHLGNVGRLEWDDPRDGRTKFRQVLGPVSTLEIWSELTRARVEFRLRNPFPDQTITIACNGQTLEEIHLGAHEEISRQYALDLHRGSNQLTLTFARYHPANAAGERPIAGRLLALDLFLPTTDGGSF